MTQQIRLSQFIVTYGPGAILEGAYGPRVIVMPEIGLFTPGAGRHPQTFEISDQRMSQGLLNGARIFRLPSNAELGVPQRMYIYDTKPFPSWGLCLNTPQHGGTFAVLYHGARCPVCGDHGRRRREAIRFIRACAQGHMDDVDWFHIVHRGVPCGHTSHFTWHGGGGALGRVVIECPQCHRQVNLGWAYGQSWRCSGRFPEREAANVPPQRPGCLQTSRIIQRQASNLRLPELKTLFTIPPRYTRLHRVLELLPVRSALAAHGAGGITSHNQLGSILQNLVAQQLISAATENEIMRHPWPEIQLAIQDVLFPVRMDYEQLLREEFIALINASVSGSPPVHGPQPSSLVAFEVIPDSIRRYPGARGRNIRVTPVSRLRTVTVQIGYSRALGDTRGNLVDVSFPDPQHPQQRWYPGAEFPGEGIFVMLDDDDGWHFPLAGTPVGIWSGVFRNPGTYPRGMFRTPLTPLHDELHPVFVWWHAFAHVLMRAISIDAGYSSTSIRERVYLEVDAAGGRVRGGILLYATQPGGESTMGGLIALVPHFDHIMNVAVDMLQCCSNDPLCLESHFEAGGYNGPACYGCLLVSETSCEHRNLWLDRQVLVNNLP